MKAELFQVSQNEQTLGEELTIRDAILKAKELQAAQETKTMFIIKRNDELVAKLLESGSVLLKEPVVSELFKAD